MHSKTRLFFIFSILILILGSIAFFYFGNQGNHPHPIPLLTVEEPTIGDPAAPVHLVVFEDPRCNNCVIFHKLYYEKLKKQFIDTNEVKYTIILVGDDLDSRTVTRMLYCLNQQSTPAFFNAINDYYENLPLALTENQLEEEMLKLISKSTSGIDQQMFSSCVAKKEFSQKAMQNTEYAKALMGGVIRTPTVYVNGIQLVRPDYKEVEKLIKKELHKSE